MQKKNKNWKQIHCMLFQSALGFFFVCVNNDDDLCRRFEYKKICTKNSILWEHKMKNIYYLLRKRRFVFSICIFSTLEMVIIRSRERTKKKCSVSEVVLCMSRWYSNGYWWGWNAISIDKMRSNHECIVDVLLSFRCAICIVHMFRRVCWHVKHIRLLAMKCGNVKRLQ